MMPETWDTDDNWKEKVMTPAKKDDHSQSADNRTERLGTPQYQCELDKELAERALENNGCPTCIFPGEDSPSN
ncbi:hypothetical protein MK292_01750 [Myxococcota bacterium]|jgi:hypothetical protein|nr:hypothetical protein [Myxococcota bacterium]